MRLYMRKILRNSSNSRLWHFALFGIVLGVVGLLSVFALSGTVYAGGGVGGGGSGGGGSGGTGNWTTYGWGWTIYNTSSAGPNDGFHNGTPWSSVQSTCQGAGASQVYAFDINDSSSNSMVYDYLTIEESPFEYANHFTDGTIVDNGRATAISTVQAQNAFGTLGSYGVNTAGFTFGVNVGWFCYDFSNGSMNGFDVNSSGASEGSGFGAKIVVDGSASSTSNPYSFGSLSGGSHTVQATAPSNYSVVGSTWCNSTTACNSGSTPTGQNYRAGNTTSITVTGNSTVQMRWIYARNDIPPIGHIDTSSCTAPSVQGWAFDPDDSSASIHVDVYEVGASPNSPLPGYGSPGGRGGGVGRYTANVSRPDVDTAYRISGNHGFKIDLTSRTKDWQPHTFYLYAIDVYSDGSAGPNNNYIGQVTIGPCAVVSCGTSSLAGVAHVGSPLNFTITIQAAGVSGGPPAPVPAASVSVTGPGGPVVVSPSSPAYSSYGSGILSFQTMSFTPPIPGTYTATYSWSDPGHTASNTATGCGSGSSVQAGSEPYFSVLGGDISAGPGFKSNTGACTTNLTAGIYGYNTGLPAYSGAGAQLAAIADGDISMFATSVTNPGGINSGAGPGSGLAFANTTATGSRYGGQFDQTNWCNPNYADNAASGLTPTAPPFPVNLTTLSGTTHVYNTDTTISGGALSSAEKLTIVVYGNVYISGPIGYASYGDVGSIPQFSLFVKGGNIYIDKSVTQLAGFYDTQPSSVGGVGTGGTIYTCASGFGKLGSADAAVYADCGNQLTVNGAVSANSLIMGRTFGDSNATSAPAEAFQFSPELWLPDAASPAGNSITGTTNNGGNAQFTTGSTAGLAAGDAVAIGGTTSYNGQWTVVSVDSPTTFTVRDAYSTADSSGTWTLVTSSKYESVTSLPPVL
jgi:hypothetical protein